MLINYIRLSLRSLLRDATYSAINIGGLAAGIAASLLLAMWIQDELSFDRFHANHQHVYKLNANFENNGNPMTWSNTNGPIGAFAEREIPAVEHAVRISGENGIMLFSHKDNEFAEAYNTAYVDSKFFTIFDFPLIKGDRENPFPDTRSIIIDQTTAKKYFGDEDPIGKVLKVEQRDEFVVQGVMRDMPKNSTIRFAILFPFKILIDRYPTGGYWKSLESDWGNYNYHTYFQLHPDASPADIAARLTALHHRHQADSDVRYSLQPLGMLHLYGPDMSETGIKTVRIFMIVAAVIILIACINYINLATARASKRAREVGVRKAVGADRSKLIGQFLTESGIITGLALLLSIVIIQPAIPFYNELSGKTLDFHLLDPSVLTLVASAMVVTWLIAGIYPAIVLSSFQPVQAIRGKLTLSGGNSTFRKVLVIAQFTLSIVIIIATLVVGQQLQFINSKDLGYNKENIFGFGLRGEMGSKISAIRNELLKVPGIVGITLADQNIMEIGNTTGDTDWDGKAAGQSLMIHPMNIDENFMKVLNMELVQGRGFSGLKADSASIVLNETAVKLAGISDPVGKTFTLWDVKATIIGVVRDFHHHSMHKTIEPTVFYSRPEWQWLLYVKTDGTHNAEAIAACEKLWKKFNPAYPFEYNFLDSFYDKMYKSERRMSALFTAFSIITVIISCLGLFGLTTFTVAQRVKEIGIRKVMGASVDQIVMILSKDFLKLVLLAMVIAVPAAYFPISRWLEGFAYRIDMGWEAFAAAGAVALAIATLTMSIQTVKAALSNPSHSLRNE